MAKALPSQPLFYADFVFNTCEKTFTRLFFFVDKSVHHKEMQQYSRQNTEFIAKEVTV
jgi:hypothetical protein